MSLSTAQNEVRPEAVARARDLLDRGQWFNPDAVAAAIVEVTVGALGLRSWPL